MNYVAQIGKVAKVLGPYFSYRGYNAKVLPDKTVVYGDAVFPSIASFITEINLMIPKRQAALMESIQRSEILLQHKS